MPGNLQLSIDEIVKEHTAVQSLGIGDVIPFGVAKHKDEEATGD